MGAGRIIGHGFYLSLAFLLAFAHPAAAGTLVLAGAWNGVGVSVRPMLFDLVGFGLRRGAAMIASACWRRSIACAISGA